MEDRYFGKELPDMKLDLPSSYLPSKLHPYVQDLIKELVRCDIRYHMTYHTAVVWWWTCTLEVVGSDLTQSTPAL